MDCKAKTANVKVRDTFCEMEYYKETLSCTLAATIN